ncbi:MAG: hypothetical protein FWC03_03420 [Treponema sp.]|nr:hypothetical protein [Treponema sp.]
MQIIEWPQFLENGLKQKTELTSMTIGIFDGVHRGHRALIERVVSFNACYTPVIVTFRENHKTRSKEQKEANGTQNDIQTFRQRTDMFEKLGILITVVMDFTDELMRMPGMDFLNILLKHGNTGFFAVGNDFRCGYKLDTGAEKIKDFFTSRSIPAEIIPQVMEGALPISSSRIRSAISAGDIKSAELMLGYAINGN